MPPMLIYPIFLLNLAFNSNQEVEMRSFYFCTRNEIIDLNKISKFGNLIKVENLDHDCLNDAFKDLYIKRISYEINSDEKLILKIQEFYQNNVFYIEIFRKKKLFYKFADIVEFYSSLDSQSKPMNTFNFIDCFDNDIYIVENNDEIIGKMKLALEYVRLSKKIVRAEDKINKVFNLIKRALVYDSVKEFNLEKELYYQQLEIKLEILFFVINKSNLVDN
ncbi:hypothetical protein NBO_386g0019 [Nosema bombycis CQ1]|uniref:Uncharacterized protein n=1 Tax=Nosema bombycis (strain CQ1 / CVCC 102059) TaxID=578461 RepID=R0KR21_NOSB1|nr:hypothetical protein NBO_386g0019 [Nosema bombycis CQ1]|eukprot:EOB12662.1 hypothetical protein NBO_386g0019 [Nosema bombycis CQ1]